MVWGYILALLVYIGWINIFQESSTKTLRVAKHGFSTECRKELNI
uniref:Uncharacterized protein n=1 Tax=Anguilla anguilla TaxID=7936 RepID=A0A0E9QHG9_ANGAN